MGGWRKPHRAEVVVGTDTSAGSRGAVEFAVHEATLRDADLVAVMSIGSGTRQDRTSAVSTGRIEAAEHRLRHFLASVGTGGVDVTMIVTTLPAVEALVDRSRFAELLVLGAPTGSVSAPESVSGRCVTSAQCAVTLVRSKRQRRQPRPPALDSDRRTRDVPGVGRARTPSSRTDRGRPHRASDIGTPAARAST
jgi:nucleotide-binding universal stress UspA family protein